MLLLAIALVYSLLIFNTDAEMSLKFSEISSHRQYLKLIYEKHIRPQDINFCVDCHRITNCIPKEIPFVMVNRKGKGLQWHQDIQIDSYIMDLSTEIEKVLDFLEEMPGWNPRAKFFVIYRKRQSVSNLLKQLFAKYITNVVIFTPVNRTTLKASTYFPFKKGHLRPKTVKSTTIATINDENLNETSVDLFPEKIPEKWKNATVRVYPVFVPPYMMCPTCPSLRGLEFLLFETVKARLGIEIKYPGNTSHTWGHKTPNGSYTLGLGEVQARRFDLALGGYHANTPENIDFDMVYPHMEDNIVVAVHSANVEARWKSIINIFQRSVWTPLSIVMLTMPIIFFAFSLFRNNQEFSSSILLSLGIIFKIAMSKLSLSRPERVLLLFWLFYSLLTDIYFESHLLGALNKANREREIDSLEKVVDMGFKVTIHKKLLKVFPDQDHKIDKYIQQTPTIFLTNSILEALNASAMDQRTAAVIMERFVKFQIPRLYLNPEDGTSMLYIVKEKLMFIPITMYFSKGFPLFNEINNLIHELKSKGLIEKLYNYSTYRNLMSFFASRSVTWKSDSLKLTEMKYIFWMLIIGLICACVVFICEILWHRMKTKNTKKSI